jgi:hypothetical protein
MSAQDFEWSDHFNRRQHKEVDVCREIFQDSIAMRVVQRDVAVAKVEWKGDVDSRAGCAARFQARNARDTAIITERGVGTEPYSESLAGLKRQV